MFQFRASRRRTMRANGILLPVFNFSTPRRFAIWAKSAAVLALIFGLAQTACAADLTLSRITPSGDNVSPGRQIVFAFDRAVVPLGRMERNSSEVPIEITPALNCQWRWIDPSNLACQLGDKDQFTPSTRYSIKVNPGLKAIDGAEMAKAVEEQFTTKLPQVESYRFETWKSPGTPNIIITFDQPVSSDSLEKHLFFTVFKNQKYVPDLNRDDYESDGEAADGPEEDEAKAETPDWHNVERKAVTLEPYNEYADSPLAETYKDRVWRVAPAKELALGARFELDLEAGVKPINGNIPTADETVVVSSYSFPEFQFLAVRCSDFNGDRVIYQPGDFKKLLPAGSPVPPKPPANVPAERLCNPLAGVELVFNAPVLKEDLKPGISVVPDLAGGRADYDPWEDVYSWSRLDEPLAQGKIYAVTLPGAKKAFDIYTITGRAEQIHDQFNRAPAANFDIVFPTSHRPPKYVFEHQISMLEKQVETHLPFFPTNLKSLKLSYSTLTADGLTSGQKKTEKLFNVEDIAYAYPIKVRELLGGRSGLVQGTFSTDPEVEERFREGAPKYFTQVTPFQVHAKFGHFNSLVWVNDLATGLPVKGATIEITIETLFDLGAYPKVIAKAVTGADGTAKLPGLETLDPKLEFLNQWQDDSPRLFARVTYQNDVGFLPVHYSVRSYSYGSSDDYFSTITKKKYGHVLTWGTTAQGIYKLGDTVQFKLYARNQNVNTLIPAPKDGYGLKVIDPLDRTVFEAKDIKLSEFGGYANEFKIEESGAVGWYRFELSNALSEDKWEPLRVLVSDFTPAPFKVTSEIRGKSFTAGDTGTVETTARLHSGGPYGDAAIRLSGTVVCKSLPIEDPQLDKFSYTICERYQEQFNFLSSTANLDSHGDNRSEFILKDIPALAGNILIESAVRDDRGKFIAAQSSAAYYGRDRYVGIRSPEWYIETGKPAAVSFVVVDTAGKAVDGVPIAVTIERSETKASRVKGAGNAYLTEYVSEWVDAGTFNLTSALKPAELSYTAEKPGSYRIKAAIKDTKDRPHVSTISTWAAGGGDVFWNPTDTNLELTPEKKSYKPGETARFLLKNPFPGAQALITAERYGVMKHWTKKLDHSTEVIEVPVGADFIPGFYLSLVLFSQRVEKPQSDTDVDLGKPAYRIGYVRVPVSDPAKQIDVSVKVAGGDTYKPGDKVKIELQSSKQNPKKPVEFAVTVIDESVFDLLTKGREYFDPYLGFYHLDALDLVNYNLLTQLVGRRKFEKKGANPGGDGGGDLALRSLFKFVSYWNPSLPADKNGRATFEFTVPDNLTGWKVFAVAVTPDDQFGLGDVKFKVNRPTEIRSILPNQVIEGDSFDAGFTVMNRSEKPRKIRVTAKAEGPVSGVTPLDVEIDAEPYKRIPVRFPVTAAATGTIKFHVEARDGIDGDAFENSIKIEPTLAPVTAASYGSTTEKSVVEKIEFPLDMRTDFGKLGVVLSPTVIGNIAGAFRYMKDYPYMCWEQMLTKGVMASHYKQLKPYLPDDIEWEGSERIPAQSLELARSHQAPNGGMVFWVPTDERVSPYLSAYTALAFNWLRAAGHKIPQDVEDRLHSYLYGLTQRSTLPSFYTVGMASSVRAVALAALAEHGKITAEDVQRYVGHLNEMSLFGQAHLLIAALKTPGTGDAPQKIAAAILNQANQTGGKFVFTENIDTENAHLLDSSLRTNCSILSALLADKRDNPALQPDTYFKLVRYITQSRGQKDYWENTQENMFCMNAMIDYSKRFESVKPDMTVTAAAGPAGLGEAKFADFRDPAVELFRKIEPDDPGKKLDVTLERTGAGRLYYSTRLQYSPKTLPKTGTNAGIEMRRETSVERDGKWVLLNSGDHIKSGELVRVDLYVSLPAARNFVVVNDPIPGGLEPVNKDLATASMIDADKGEFDRAGGSIWFTQRDWIGYQATFWSFYHRELRNDSARFYSDFLPAGNYHLAYTAQAISPGRFIQLPTHAEEMYDPDVFGNSEPRELIVDGAP